MSNPEPMYFQSFEQNRMEEYYRVVADYSAKFWCYLAYTGMRTPWHEDRDAWPMFLRSKQVVNNVFREMDYAGLRLQDYCILSFSISSHYLWDDPLKLLGQRNHWECLRVLGDTADDPELVQLTADFAMKFFEAQIEKHKAIQLQDWHKIRYMPGTTTKCFLYAHDILEHVRKLKKENVNPLDWLDTRLAAVRPQDEIQLKYILSEKFSPKAAAVREYTTDAWREIKTFLGLPMSCKIVDGFIPKGWVPANDDSAAVSKIDKIQGDGFYFYKSGERRRGRRHYEENVYLGIRCNPNNFHLFKETWRNTGLYSARPTWEEYRDYAMYPNRWVEDGTAVNGRVKSVKWRKK